MTITTCQKVTLISCSVLCVSLFLPKMLLPRGKKEKGQSEVGPGFYPSVTHQFSVPGDPERWDVDPSPSLTHTVEAMVKVKSMEQGRKYNLMAKVIPIYGFGILLYILYIIHKLSCREKMNKSGIYTVLNLANMPKTTSSDYELARLQQRLLQAEMMMERIVSGKSHCSSRRQKSKISTSKKEEKLLRQLQQISLLMQESRLEGASPEMEAEEVPYGADWEGYPEETYPEYDSDSSYRRRFEKLRQEEPPSQPTAEALAERMEQEEEEIMARKLSIVQEEDEEEEDEDREEEKLNEGEKELDEGEEEAEDYMEGVEEDIKEKEDDEEDEEEEKKQLLSPASAAVERKQERLGLEVSKELQHLSGGKKQISFSDQKRVFHYPKEETQEEEEREDETEEDEGTEVEEEEEEADDDDDPLTEAESLQFSCEGSSNPEEGAEEEIEEYLPTLAPVEGEGHLQADRPKNIGQSGLRMRNRRQT